jgi:aminopeptidase N
VVETQESLPAEFGASDDPGGASFPGGVLLDERAFSAGLSSEPVLELAEYELARSWFGWIVRPDPTAQILLGRGAGLYAVTLAARARGGESARDAAVSDLLRRYEAARERAADRPLLDPATGYPHEQRVASGYKAALFFVALEERAGTEPLRRAMHRIFRDMAGNVVGAAELRSAVEGETHQSFAEFFRVWLNQPGIPAAFLAAHQGDAGATAAPTAP